MINPKTFFKPERVLIAVLMLIALNGCQLNRTLDAIEFSISQPRPTE